MSEENLENNSEKEFETKTGTGEISTSEDAESAENESSPRRKFFVILGIVLFVLALVLGYFYIERRKEITASVEEEKPEAVVSVKVAKVEKETIAQEFTAIGTVAPAEQSTVAASISAQIKQMRLLKNQSVTQGEVLA